LFSMMTIGKFDIATLPRFPGLVFVACAWFLGPQFQWNKHRLLVRRSIYKFGSSSPAQSGA